MTIIYLPNSFLPKNDDEIYKLIKNHGFATLISTNDKEPFVSHTPILMDIKKKVLRGHLSKNNPHCKSLLENKKIIAIFHGPHHYVSPTYYKNQPSVPTWNYAVVHISGSPRLITNRKEIIAFLSNLIDTYESDKTDQWDFNLPKDYLKKMIDSIVFFEVAIENVAAKYKLSQNRPKEDVPNIIDHLFKIGTENSIDIAQLMIDNVKTN